MIGRTVMPGDLHVDQQERDALLLLRRVRIGAHQAEDPVGVLAERVPGLLAVDDVVVALAFGARLERREVGARARLRIALAPPVFAADDARQEALLLRRAAERHDHRRDHLQAERNRARRAGGGGFLVEDVQLHRTPAGAAELLRPARRAPALRCAGSSASACSPRHGSTSPLLMRWAMSAGSCSRRNARTSSRNASSSGVKFRSMEVAPSAV